MQTRRGKGQPPSLAPTKTRVVVAPEYWETLQKKDTTTLGNLTLFQPVSSRQMEFRFLNEDVRIDLENRCFKRRQNSQWEKTDDPLLELVTVLYLNNVREIYPLGRDIVGTADLKEAHFFHGQHALQLDSLLKRYGNDIDGFRKAAEHLAGEPLDMADAAYKLWPFPRLPLYYLLWEGDEEFKPRIKVLFDRPIETVFAADAIWGLVNRVSESLLTASDELESW
jgi:hypothetical protein